MWKQVYNDYQTTYLDSYIVEETFKNWLWNILKKIKIWTSNVKGSKKAKLQCDEVLECLKATNLHATRNVLKRCQSLIDGAPIAKTPSSTPSFSWFEPITPNRNPSPSLDFTPSKNDSGEKSMTKSKMLQNQSTKHDNSCISLFNNFPNLRCLPSCQGGD